MQVGSLFSLKENISSPSCSGCSYFPGGEAPRCCFRHQNRQSNIFNAVDLAYEDGAEEKYDRELAQVLEEAQHCDPRDVAPQAISPVFEDLDAPETIAAFQKLCHTLDVENQSGEMSVEALKACVSRLEDDMLPIVQHAQSDALGILDDPKALEEAIPIGFTTGDEVVDKAVRVLRVLYAKDFRRLQNAIDDAIVKQQEITANPRTETARGKTRKSR
jgi:hypothetical protein